MPIQKDWHFIFFARNFIVLLRKTIEKFITSINIEIS